MQLKIIGVNSINTIKYDAENKSDIDVNSIISYCVDYITNNTEFVLTSDNLVLYNKGKIVDLNSSIKKTDKLLIKINGLTKMEEDRVACITKGCKFFGTKSSEYLCSICYSKSKKRKKATPSSATPNSHQPEYDNECDDYNALKNRRLNIDKIRETMNEQSKCVECSKRVGLLGFVCSCGGIYCGSHRNENDHTCTYDYKDDKDILKKTLVKVSNNKLETI